MDLLDPLFLFFYTYFLVTSIALPNSKMLTVAMAHGEMEFLLMKAFWCISLFITVFLTVLVILSAMLNLFFKRRENDP